jgi:hypothetical protein
MRVMWPSAAMSGRRRVGPRKPPQLDPPSSASSAELDPHARTHRPDSSLPPTIQRRHRDAGARRKMFLAASQHRRLLASHLTGLTFA